MQPSTDTQLAEAEQLLTGLLPGWYQVDGEQVLLRNPAMKGLPTGSLIAEAVGPAPGTTPFAFVLPGKDVRPWGGRDMPLALRALELLTACADPITYGEAFAASSGFCWRCGKALSRTESVQRGVGPICWARMQARRLELGIGVDDEENAE
jgi:hypothetical protein